MSMSSQVMKCVTKSTSKCVARMFISAALLVGAITMATAESANQDHAALLAGTLSGGGEVFNPPAGPLPPLRFTEAQKAQIRMAVDERSSDVDFPLSAPQPAGQFNPAVGVAVPTTLQGQTLPVWLTDKIPVLKQYLYVKLSDEAVIIDPMSNKVAEIVSLP